MSQKSRGFVTILTGTYAFQDCVHFLAAIRKFHKEPILILTDRVPKYLYPILLAFGNVTLKQSPSNSNLVLASRLAKLAMYKESPFDLTIYMDNDICLLDNIDEIFEYLEEVDFLAVPDLRSAVSNAINLLRVKQDPNAKYDVLSILQSMGLEVTENTVHYNSGFMAFRKSKKNEMLFDKWKDYFTIVVNNQNILHLRDQGALAAAIEVTQPDIKKLSPTYNYLSLWKESYGEFKDPVKVLHCTYSGRPQYAKNVSRAIYTRIFDRLARFLLPQRNKNPWRYSKADNSDFKIDS